MIYDPLEQAPAEKRTARCVVHERAPKFLLVPLASDGFRSEKKI